MSVKKFFLDTNIIIYTFDQAEPNKQKIAQRLLEQALLGEGCISYQVIQEFLNVALKRFSPVMPTDKAQRYTDNFLTPICEYYPDRQFYSHGLSIQNRWRFSWYDSLIITAALETECEILYSEDLQHNQKIESLTIVNPFI